MFKCCVPFELIWFQRACACGIDMISTRVRVRVAFKVVRFKDRSAREQMETMETRKPL